MVAGSTGAFVLAIVGVLAWIISGPYYHFSNTWLVTISAITSAVVFIMVFSIQSTQNRDSRAVHLKLNELIVANQKARNTFVGLEELTDAELDDIDEEFKKLLFAIDPTHALHKLHNRVIHEKTKRVKSALVNLSHIQL